MKARALLEFTTAITPMYVHLYTENPVWLIGAYAPTGLKSFFKMSKNFE
jgi:hypothetical protein